jgi:hypothetical protein
LAQSTHHLQVLETLKTYAIKNLILQACVEEIPVKKIGIQTTEMFSLDKR